MIDIQPRLITANNVPYLQFNGKQTYRGGYRAVIFSPNGVIRPVQAIGNYGSISKRCTHQQAFPGDYAVISRQGQSAPQVQQIDHVADAKYVDVIDDVQVLVLSWLDEHPDIRQWLMEIIEIRRDMVSYLPANENWVGADAHLNMIRQQKSNSVALFFRGAPEEFVARVVNAASVSRLCMSQWNWGEACEEFPSLLTNDVIVIEDDEGLNSSQWDEWIVYDKDGQAHHIIPPATTYVKGNRRTYTGQGTTLDFVPAHMIKVTFGSRRFKGHCRGLTWQLFGSF